MRIGVISDTHGFFDPKLHGVFVGVDAIIHAGDAGSREVLDELSTLAPVTAVKGNVDSPLWELALSSKRQWAGLWIETLHILPAPQASLEAWSRGPAHIQNRSRQMEAFLGRFSPETQLVIFGHSHEPMLVHWAGKLFLNPGSAGRKRFSLPRCCALIHVQSDLLEVNFASLEGYNEGVPEKLRITLKELGSC